MPNIWTHIMFAEQVANSVQFEMKKEEENFFRLGAQGPDPFFYHNFWPWLKQKPVYVIGSALHYNHCGDFLMDMIQFGKKNDDSKLRAYILGFVTHHLLDRNTHPYIIYRSGNEGSKHTQLETIIDTLMMKRDRGTDSWKNPVYKQIDVGPSLHSPIKNMLSELIKKHFKKEEETMPANYVEQSYKQLVLAHKVLFDRFGWKNKMLRKLIASYSHKRITDSIDYLNLNHTEWFHPADLSESSKESFIDLFNNALKEGEEIFPLIIRYWDSRTEADDIESVKSKIGNRSYDTGKELSLGLVSVHFDPIL